MQTQSRPYLDAINLSVFENWIKRLLFNLRNLIGWIWSKSVAIITKLRLIKTPNRSTNPLRFKREKILDNVSLKIKTGEILVIMGPSGAGKSTLLRLLSGQTSTRHGHINLWNLSKERRETPGATIGFLHQDDILHSGLTVEQALRFSARIKRPTDSISDINADIVTVMRKTKIYYCRKKKINRLSGGERRRVNLAAELLSKAGFLFLDEPTSNLDPYHSRELIELARSTVNDEKAVIIATHDAWNEDLYQKIVFLVEGKLVFSGFKEDALKFFNVTKLHKIYSIFESIEDDKKRFQTVCEYEKKWHNQVQVEAKDKNIAERNTKHFEEKKPWKLWKSSLRIKICQCWVLIQRFIKSYLIDMMPLLLLLQPIVGAGLITLTKPYNSFTDLKEAKSITTTLIILIAIMGLVNSHRVIARERVLYHQEQMSGLTPTPYLLSKLIILYIISIFQVGIMLFIIGLKIEYPTNNLIMLSHFEIFVSLSLCSFINVNLGCLVSSIVKTARQATNLLAPILAIELILGGFSFFQLEGIFNDVGNLVPTSWTYQAIGTTLNLNSFNIRKEDIFEYSQENLTNKWFWLGILFMGYALITIIILVFQRRRNAPRHIRVILEKLNG